MHIDYGSKVIPNNFNYTANNYDSYIQNDYEAYNTCIYKVDDGNKYFVVSPRGDTTWYSGTGNQTFTRTLYYTTPSDADCGIVGRTDTLEKSYQVNFPLACAKTAPTTCPTAKLGAYPNASTKTCTLELTFPSETMIDSFTIFGITEKFCCWKNGSFSCDVPSCNYLTYSVILSTVDALFDCTGSYVDEPIKLYFPDGTVMSFKFTADFANGIGSDAIITDCSLSTLRRNNEKE